MDKEKCYWRPESGDWVDENCWDTGCDNNFIFNDGGPFANNFEYCPYCGKKLEEDC